MSRYIDAETIKVSITRYGECVVKHKHLNFIKEMVKEIISDVCFAIDAQPTVDVVPVVRCKDCKYRRGDGFCKKYQRNIDGSTTMWFAPDNDWFCADGERATD